MKKGFITEFLILHWINSHTNNLFGYIKSLLLLQFICILSVKNPTSRKSSSRVECTVESSQQRHTSRGHVIITCVYASRIFSFQHPVSIPTQIQNEWYTRSRDDQNDNNHSESDIQLFRLYWGRVWWSDRAQALLRMWQGVRDQRAAGHALAEGPQRTPTLALQQLRCWISPKNGYDMTRQFSN